MTKDHAVIPNSGISYVIYDSLAIKYGGADGMYFGSCSHVIVRQLEVSWIGGGCLEAGPRFHNPKECTRFGNGIEFSDWGGPPARITENNELYGNRLWEIYDAALSPQGGGNYYQRNLSFHHNIIAHSEYCFEIWSQGNTSECQMEHVRFDNNLCLNSGGGWSHAVRPDPSGRHICSFDNSCEVSDISYRNNLFYQSVPYEGGWWMGDKWGRYPCAKGLCGWKGLVLADHNLWYIADPALGPLVIIGGEPPLSASPTARARDGSWVGIISFGTANFSKLMSLTGSGLGAVVGKDPRLRGLAVGAKLNMSTDLRPLADSPAVGAGRALGW
jgi:hypothetical protein